MCTSVPIPVQSFLLQNCLKKAVVFRIMVGPFQAFPLPNKLNRIIFNVFLTLSSRKCSQRSRSHFRTRSTFLSMCRVGAPPRLRERKEQKHVVSKQHPVKLQLIFRVSRSRGEWASLFFFSPFLTVKCDQLSCALSDLGLRSPPASSKYDPSEAAAPSVSR